MKIAIVGPGAMGCLIAAFKASRTKEDIWLVDHDAKRAEKISKSGIKIEGLNGVSSIKLKVTAEPKDIGPVDLVVICVKSYSTEEACKTIKDIVSDKTYVLTLQNGIGNVQILNDHFGHERVVAGITSHGATLLDVGHVRHAGKGETIIGKPGGKFQGAIREIANILTKAGFETKVSKDINSIIWGKVIINVGINALTAITRLRNGALIEYDETKALLGRAVQEAVRVVKRKRIKLVYDDPIQKVESVCKATATNISSMLQDILNKKRTEIDFINGAIVRQGHALGIPTPVNEILTNLVKTIESTYQKVITER